MDRKKLPVIKLTALLNSSHQLYKGIYQKTLSHMCLIWGNGAIMLLREIMVVWGQCLNGMQKASPHLL